MGAPFRYCRDTWSLRTCDPGRLLAARSIDALHDLQRSAPFLSFNGQVLRCAFVVALAERLGCTSFVETGTYAAATTIAARRFLRVPVYSCEIVPRLMLKAQLRTLSLDGVRLCRGDSARWLPALVKNTRLGGMPFFYLDAHAGGRRLPLADELQTASSLERFVAVIDDFQVPGRPDFGFDTYAGHPIGVEFIRRFLGNGARVFLPAHDAREETGARRGTAVIAQRCPIPSDLSRWGFPFTLFAEPGPSPRHLRRMSAAAEKPVASGAS